MNKVILFMVLIMTLSILGGCAGTGGGLNSISKTNQLMPGMSANNVKNILGNPSQTQFISEKWVWKYSLHQVWKGFIPYYLIFGKEDQKLKSWYADEAEYMRQQQLWLQAIPPTQKHEVEVKVQ